MLSLLQDSSLAGLDDTTAEGLNGFKTLENIITNFLGRKKQLLDRLDQAKRYLKIAYPQNCVEHSQCSSHCISLALSDPNEGNLSKDRHCSEGHNATCKDCTNMYSLLDELPDMVNGLPNSKDLAYDVSIAKENILKW